MLETKLLVVVDGIPACAFVAGHAPVESLVSDTADFAPVERYIPSATFARTV